MTIRDIKDNSPNQALIKQLETLLEYAKSGEIRSIFTICSWNDGSMTHGWAYDERSSRRRILSEMMLLQHDYITDIEFAEGDTVLAKRFEEWE